MKKLLVMLLFWAVSLATFSASPVVAERREIVFPSRFNEVASQPGGLGFAHGMRVGVAFANSVEGYSAGSLFSFLLPEGRVVDELDLVPDFGEGQSLANIPILALNVHEATGLIIVYGRDSNFGQKLLAVSSDDGGHLRRLWVRTFSLTRLFPGGGSAVDFSIDGSRIYFIYFGSAPQPAADNGNPNVVPTRSRWGAQAVDSWRSQNRREATDAVTNVSFGQRVALLRTEDGATLSSIDVPDAAREMSVFFDGAHGRAVALSGTSAYVFASGTESLQLETRIQPGPEVSFAFGQGLTADGRFLLAYGNYEDQPDGTLSNIYISYDLGTKTVHRSSVGGGELFAVLNNLTLHRPTGMLLVPLQVRFGDDGEGTTVLQIGGFRRAEVISVEGDGSMSRAAEVKIPKRSPGASRKNFMSGNNNIAVSSSGALGFVSSARGRLFAFDTATGDIVNDELVDPDRMFYIQLLEPLGKMVFSNGAKLILVDTITGPLVADVEIDKKRTIVKGANFLSGARIELNGTDLGLANRNPDNPGHEVILDRGKKDFPIGEEFTVVVVNRDGLRSTPLTFSR
ncbi:MAG TPA: hypothetical protein VJH03_11120 [Blastocatellia bacterium]|nr:hypothetical protein [Blastocatellia bacterium]